jgi:2,5-diamino-6-(ribosylamino)-4(3H)-pyrimidinone 5'-phosphate reductase
LNAEFLRRGLIDFLSIVVEPALVGGKDTPTLIDGESLSSDDDLLKIKSLELEEVKELDNSYLHLKYKVLN